MKNALLVIASVLFALLLLEGGLRLAMRSLSNQPDPVAAQRHLYDAYRTHRLNPAYNTKNNTLGRTIHSPDGFRQDEPVRLDKPEKTIRIIMLGGSALYGIGSWDGPYPQAPDLMNDETVNHHLETLLNQRLEAAGSGYRTEVVNAGLIGYQTFQHLVHLNERLLDYQPDIVVSLDGHNDFYMTDPAHRPWLDYGYGARSLVELVNERGLLAPVHLFVRALAPYSALATQIEKRLTGPAFDRALDQERNAEVISARPFSPEDYRTAAGRGFLRSLWQIKRLGELEGYEYLLFLQPEVVFESDENLSEGDRAIKAVTLDHLPEGAAESMRQVRAALPGLFEEYGLPFADLGEIGPLAGGEADLYIDYCHLKPAGSAVVARAMLDEVAGAVDRAIALREAAP